MTRGDQFIVDVSFGGYSILGLAEELLVPEKLPSPPGLVEPLEGAVEVVESGAFVWALDDVTDDEKVRLILDEPDTKDGVLDGAVTRHLAFVASGPVVVNTFDWEFVTALPLAEGAVELEVIMVPAALESDSMETHYLRLLDPANR